MNLKYALSALVASPLLLLVQGATKYYNWTVNVQLGNKYSPDCQNLAKQRRWLFLVEDESKGVYTFPGAAIEANEGDEIVIRLVNEHHSLTTSIHWHGIHQLGTPFMDGPSMITQCPLGPMQEQEYRFAAYPPGTHIWHAHTGLDVADGMIGPIIVHPKDPPGYAYDEERMVLLQDFFIETGEDQMAGLDAWPFVFVDEPDSLLINGKGLATNCRSGMADATVATRCCLSTDECPAVCSDTLAWMSTIKVKAGKTYRLRVINGSQLVAQNLAIVGHKLTIVEAEGTVLAVPLVVDNYDIGPGSRAEILITADKTPDNYLIETSVRGRNIPGLLGKAILNYDSVSVAMPTGPSPDHPFWSDDTQALINDKALKTKNPEKYDEYKALQAPEGNFTRYVLVGLLNTKVDIFGRPYGLKWSMNGISNKLQAEPLIGKAIRTARELGWPAKIEGTLEMPKDPPILWNFTYEKVPLKVVPLIQQGTTVINLKQGDVIELVFQNAYDLTGSSDIHTWHSHGFSFWVVGQGLGNYNRESSPSTYNVADPMLRDNVVLWPYGWTAIRLYANNPGVWFFHCHISSHLHMGMAFSLVVSPDLIEHPSESVEFCRKHSLYPTKK